jgi:acetylornithine deacetylase/succinyl-diaminopimelate desuccinylase-like protein
MFAAIANAKDDLPSSFGLLLTAREESDLTGIKAVARHYEEMQKRLPRSRVELMIGAGNNESIATGSRGVLEARFTLGGQTKHTSRRAVFDFTDAIDARDQIVGDLKSQINAIPEHPTYGQASFKRTADRGGFFNGQDIVDTTNQVPNRAEATLGIRLNGMPFNGQELNPDLLKSMVAGMVGHYEKDGISLIDYNTLAFVRAAITDPEKAQWIIDLVEQRTGRKMKGWDYGDHGLEEIVELVSVLDPSPALVITGPAESSQYHMQDEHITTDSLIQWEDIYRKIITDDQFKTKK